MKILFILTMIILCSCSHTSRKPATTESATGQYEYPNPEAMAVYADKQYRVGDGLRGVAGVVAPCYLDRDDFNKYHRNVHYGQINSQGEFEEYNKICRARVFSADQIKHMLDEERRQNIGFLERELDNLLKNEEFIDAVVNHPSLKNYIDKKISETLKQTAISK